MKVSELKITDLRVAEIDGLPKHCILLKIYTNLGLIGYGELRDASSANYALMLKSRLLGENPLNVEKLFNRIKQFGGHSRQGGGVSGIEIALLDIVGKYYKIPMYQLLGGKYRDTVRIYCDTDVDDKHIGRDMGKALKKRMKDGYTYLKMDLGIELLYDIDGALNAPLGFVDELKNNSLKAISHQSGSIDKSLMRGKNYEIFTIPHHATGIHITEKGLDYLENYLSEVREEIGYEIPLAIDHFGHVAIEDAARFCKRIEKYNIAWLEDIAPWIYTQHYKKLSDRTNVPLCTGEDIYLAKNFLPLLKENAVSIVHPDLLTIGGAMQLKKLGDMCEDYGVAMALHMAESPIGFLAAVHTAAAVKNVLAVEFHSVDYPDWYKLVNPTIKIENGFVPVPDLPGLGIESLNEELIAKYLKDDTKAWADSLAWDKEWSNDREWS